MSQERLRLSSGFAAELCRERFPRRVTLGLWAQAEVIAMATDLAVFGSGAVALNLLFGIALFPAGVITAIATLTMTGNRKRYEAVIAGMLAAILLAFLYETIVAGGNLGALGAGLLPSSRAASRCCSQPASSAPR